MGFAQRQGVVFFRCLLTEGAVELDVLQEEHRIWIGNRRGQQALGIVGIGGNHNLETRRLHKDAFKAVRVQFRCAHTTAIRGAHDHRTCASSRTAEAHTRGLGNELIHADKEKTRELDLGDWAQAIHRHTHGTANNGRLR